MMDEYLKARKLAERQVRKALFENRDPYLPFLDDAVNDQNQRNLGTLEIPMFRIKGTKNESRRNSFSEDFLPLPSKDSEFAYKWSKVFDYQVEEGLRDPIKVYEYLQDFYVEEGNKRVSVLRYLDVPSVYADVIRIIPEEKDPLYEEFLSFYEKTGLYCFRFHSLHSYEKLLSLYGDEAWTLEKRHYVEASLYRFSAAVYEKKGREIEEYISDAFLIYLSLYSEEDILDIARKVLDNRIDTIWEEILLNGYAKENGALEAPEEGKKDTPFGLFKNIFKPEYNEKNPLSIAFLYKHDESSSAWTKLHEEGRKKFEQSYEGIVRTMSYPDCGNGDEVRDTIRKAIEEGAKLVFTTSAEDLDATWKASVEFPDIRFYNCSLNKAKLLVPTYAVRLYEVKFLMGALAAMMSENHKIGYVSDYPVYGHIASINAFAIGASLFDPKAEVYLEWSTDKTRFWKDEIAKNDVSVICGHDLVKPSWGEDELGLFMKNDAGNIPLAKVRIDFGTYYNAIVSDVLEGEKERKDRMKEHKTLSYWYGLKSGVTDIVLADNVPYPSKKTLEYLRDELIEGRLDPFFGEIRFQSGDIQEPYTYLPQEKIISMDRLVENIRGTIPDKEELIEEAKDFVDSSGVKQ